MAKAEREKQNPKEEKQLELGASMSYRIPLKMNPADFEHLDRQPNKNGMITRAIGLHRVISQGSTFDKLTICFGQKEAERLISLLEGIPVEQEAPEKVEENTKVVEQLREATSHQVSLSSPAFRSVSTIAPRGR